MHEKKGESGRSSLSQEPEEEFNIFDFENWGNESDDDNREEVAPIGVSELAVLTIPADLSEGAQYHRKVKEIMREWGYFTPENCARAVFILPKYDFDELLRGELSFLQEDGSLQRNKRFNIFYGIDAYAFLVQLTSGVISQHPAESHALSQVRNKFDKWKKKASTTNIMAISDLVDNVLFDASKIQGSILRSYRLSSNIGSAIQDSASVSSQDRVLFITDKGYKNNAGACQHDLDILRKLGKKGKRKVQEVCIVHTGEFERGRIFEKLATREWKDKVHFQITSISMDEVRKLPEGHPYTLIITNQHLSEENDYGVNAYARVAKNRRIVIMDTEDSQQLDSRWSDSGINTSLTIYPEQLKERFQQIQKRNYEIIQQAKYACVNCAAIRERGHDPSSFAKILGYSPEDFEGAFIATLEQMAKGILKTAQKISCSGQEVPVQVIERLTQLSPFIKDETEQKFIATLTPKIQSARLPEGSSESPPSDSRRHSTQSAPPLHVVPHSSPLPSPRVMTAAPSEVRDAMTDVLNAIDEMPDEEKESRIQAVLSPASDHQPTLTFLQQLEERVAVDAKKGSEKASRSSSPPL